jgi:molybdopterin-guanine dinucleotide biosynthesis protein A
VARAEIEKFDEDGRSFANINSPQDLEEASEQ